ncbi:hypothetical protein EC1094_923 [Escherichia coli]|nr:hypothetical protein EC1094_923 [Escherichia coli]SMZ42860.1 hypothetical protein EC1094V2_4924 [Escherichia coli]
MQREPVPAALFPSVCVDTDEITLLTAADLPVRWLAYAGVCRY